MTSERGRRSTEGRPWRAYNSYCLARQPWLGRVSLAAYIVLESSQARAKDAPSCELRRRASERESESCDADRLGEYILAFCWERTSFCCSLWEFVCALVSASSFSSRSSCRSYRFRYLPHSPTRRLAESFSALIHSSRSSSSHSQDSRSPFYWEHPSHLSHPSPSFCVLSP